MSQKRQAMLEKSLKIDDSIYQNKTCHCKMCKNKNPNTVGHSGVRVMNDRKKSWE
jgi:hypothetical protein